jgi:hypothetical protein
MEKPALTGTWTLDVLVDDKQGVATFEIVEGEDGVLNGTYAGQLGSARITGSVRGADVEFGFDWHHGRVTYRGTHEGGMLSGTCTYGSVGTGTFEGGRAVN